MNVLRRSALALVCITLGSSVFLGGCSKQGEGERCDLDNGGLDCEPGLSCTPAERLSIEGEGRGVALCCPPDGTPQTVNACRAGSDLPDEDRPAEAPLDAGDGGS